jgi:hypothetical protein
MAALSAHGEIPSDPTQVHPLPVVARAPMPGSLLAFWLHDGMVTAVENAENRKI